MSSKAEVAVIQYEQIVEGTRFREDYGDLSDLVESFKQDGIIQPLAVKRDGEGKFQLIAGGRRYRACPLAGITDVPVRIYPEHIDEYTFRSIELMENIIRKDLAWHEVCKLKKEINDLYIKMHGKKVSTSPDAPGWSQAQTADLLGVAKGSLSDDIKLAEALEALPALKTAKTKAEANKILRNAEESLIRGELAKRLQSSNETKGVERVHHELINRYIVGDFFEVVKKVPSKSIDIVELDPPYGIALNESKEALENQFYTSGNYNEVSAEKYEQFLAGVLEECWRIMSENSWLICWFAAEPWLEDIYHSITGLGFKTSRLVGMWTKKTGQTKSPTTQLASCWEPFFYARKGMPVIGKQGRSNVFDYKGVTSSRKTHPTERPIEMLQDILATFGWQGARVFVPFLGSGNTILAAANLGMQAFGCDLAQEYKDSYIIKVTSNVPGQYKSYRDGGSDERDGDEG